MLNAEHDIQAEVPFDKDGMRQEARSRSQLYLLLARVFATEMDRSFLDQMKDEKIQTVLKSLGIDLDPINRDDDADGVIDFLAEEYAYLFVGPGKHIAPYESVQIKRGSGLLMGKETAVVCQFIKDAGFDFLNRDGKIPDHISIELEFLGHLAEAEAKALDANEMDAYLSCIGWQHKFITTHLGKWAADFARRVKERASVPFYKSFASILPRFLASEKAWLGKTIHDHRGG